MARNKQTSTLDDLFEIMQTIFTYVPPWLSIPVAGICYVVIANSVNAKIAPTHHIFGHLLAGMVAMACLAGGVSGFLIRKKKAALVKTNITIETVNGFTWQEFEKLVGLVFSARGYSVEHTGGGGADGGVDLRLRKDGETVLVQCKRWKVFKVGVKPIREFYGVMTSEGVDRGIFVSSGVYTKEALEFAEGKPLEIIDGAQFAEMVRAVQGVMDPSGRLVAKVKDLAPMRPTCPNCGEGMILRKAKHSSTVGQEFWGCSKFPNCRGTRRLDGSV
ncbi:MAG: restriction endonuclease [Verrucomicrobiales bacterium]